MPEAPRAEIAKLEALHAEHPQGRIFTHLAEAYRKAGELERARKVLAEGIDRHPDYSSAHVVLGRVLMDMGEQDGAASEFQRVLELDAHNLVALRCLGDLARDDGRRDEAAAYYGQLLDVEPSDEDVRRLLEELESAPAEGEVGSPGMAAEEAPSPGGLMGPAGLDEEEGFADELTAADDIEPADDLAQDEDLGPAPGTYDEPAAEEEPDFGEPVEATSADERDEPWVTGGAADEGSEFPSEGDELPGLGSEAPGVMTETIAQIYARQGLYDRAAEVYRELVRMRPGDASLRTRLEEMETLAAAPSPGTGDVEGEESALDHPVGAGAGPEEEPVAFDSGPIEGFESNEVDAGIDVAPLAGLESDELDPETHLRPVEGAPAIEGVPEDSVRDVPAPPEEESPWATESGEAEEEYGPWASYGPAEGGIEAEASAEPEGEPEAEAWSQGVPDEDEDPWSTGESEPEEAPWSTGVQEPEPEAPAPEEEPAGEEPWAPAAGADESWGPWAGPGGAADAGEAEPLEEEQVESVWTGAEGVSAAEESPYAWADTEEEGESDASEPIGSYLRSLLGWGGDQDVEPPAGPDAEESDVERSAGAEAAPESSSDDDDLDTFRSWLESLKK